MNKDQHEDWNPRDVSILNGQRRAYDEMHERCPVAHSEFLGWADQQWTCLAGWIHGNQNAAFNQDPVTGRTSNRAITLIRGSGRGRDRAAPGERWRLLQPASSNDEYVSGYSALSHNGVITLPRFTN